MGNKFLDFLDLCYFVFVYLIIGVKINERAFRFIRDAEWNKRSKIHQYLYTLALKKNSYGR